jgi:hypothetical protein
VNCKLALSRLSNIIHHLDGEPGEPVGGDVLGRSGGLAGDETGNAPVPIIRLEVKRLAEDQLVGRGTAGTALDLLNSTIG